MKLRNILITAAAVGFMFASANRVGVVGYSAGDYSDMDTYPHMAAGQNVAYTMGDDFTAVWSDGGTTWGFTKVGPAPGEYNESLVDMMWSNGTYGVSFGLNMDSDEAVGTTMDLGFGMNLAGWDVAFAMGTNTDAGDPMKLNARGALGFWAFDTMTFEYESGGATGAEYSTIDVNMYGVKDWGSATGMFAMGFENTDASGILAHFGGTEAVTLITNTFSVESTLTDWCDLRVGYDTKFNIGAEADGVESWDSFSAGVGFNYGSVQLDMTLSDLGGMVGNPIHYLNGRNTTPLSTNWTLSYTW